jgi:iron complex transport system permease protein
VAAAVLAVLSLCIGPAGLSPAEIWRGLAGTDPVSAIVVREIRLPRTLLALIIGFTLGLAGAATQGLFRNPLAEPSVLGASAAAALGAVLALSFGLAGATSFGLALAAMGGALLAGMALVAVARRVGDLTSVLLTGLALTSFAGAGTTLVLSLSANPFALADIVFWLIGSLEDRSMRHVAMAAPFALAGALLLIGRARALRALTLGEETAASLGFHPARTAGLVVAGVALGVGAGVAVAGAIGFVGLVAPAMVRPFVGHDPARALVPAGLAGAVLLLAADILARLVPSTSELKVGVVTALVGVPVFVWIVLGRRAIWRQGGAP